MTARDLDFLVDALAPEGRRRAPLRDLTTDPGALDRLLDDPRLFERLLAAPRLLDVSPWFFYYVLVRRAFLDHGIDSSAAADYVGALLSFHLERRAEREGGGRYLVDLVRASAEARNPADAFRLQTAIGDLSLVLTGVFPDWVHHRATYGRRTVDFGYYESMGRRYYGVAARSETAARLELRAALLTIAGRFVEVRRALNDLVDDHLHLAPRPETVDRLFRRALDRGSN